MPPGKISELSNNTYCLGEKTKYTGLGTTNILRRDCCYISPCQGGVGPYSVSGNNSTEIQFQFDQKGFIDFNTLRFEFYITLLTDAGGLAAPKGFKFKTDASSIIQKIIIESAGRTITEIDGYNAINSFFTEALKPRNHLVTQHNLLENYWDIAPGTVPWDGATLATSYVRGIKNNDAGTTVLDTITVGNPRVTYSHHFNMGFMGIPQYFPAHLLQNFKIILQLTRGNDAFLGYSQTNQSWALANITDYTVTNPRIYYEKVEMDEVFQDAVRKVASENALYIPFLQMDKNINTLLTTETTQKKMTISQKVGSLKSVFMFGVDSASDNANLNGSAIANFGFADPVTVDETGGGAAPIFQFKLGGRFIPIQPINTSMERNVHLMRALGNYLNYDGSVGFGRGVSYTGVNHFENLADLQTVSIVANPIAKKLNAIGYDFDREDCADLICGLNTLAPQVSLDLFFTPPAVARTLTKSLYTLTLINATLRILASGQVDILR